MASSSQAGHRPSTRTNTTIGAQTASSARRRVTQQHRLPPPGRALPLGDPADQPDEVDGREDQSHPRDRHQHEVVAAVQLRGRVERAEQGEHLAPEAGQAGQPQAGDGGEREQAAQSRACVRRGRRASSSSAAVW